MLGFDREAVTVHSDENQDETPQHLKMDHRNVALAIYNLHNRNIIANDLVQLKST